MIVRTHAKINLGLYITDERPNGYHELASIFLPIELHDVLEISSNTKSKDLTISVSGSFAKSCPTDQSNIIHKAFDKMCEVLEDRGNGRQAAIGLNVHIVKNIPAEAGLGGGSSNAAGFLTVLNQLWNLKLTNEELKTIGARIGTDVPFFIDSLPAMVEGIGDIIRPFDLQKDYWVVLAKPPRGLSTAQVYRDFSLGLTLKSRNAKYSELLRSLSFQGLKRAEELKTLSNDLERVSSAILPDIIAVREYLETLDPLVSMMSGSGSAVFALFDNEPKQPLLRADQKWFLCTTKVLRGHYANYRNQGLPGK